jgi:hypothetical protein
VQSSHHQYNCPVINEEVGMHRNAIRPVISWVSATCLSGIQSSRSATNPGLLNICFKKFTDLTKNTWGLLENSDTHPNKLNSITQLIILANNFHSFWGAGNREHNLVIICANCLTSCANLTGILVQKGGHKWLEYCLLPTHMQGFL